MDYIYFITNTSAIIIWIFLIINIKSVTQAHTEIRKLTKRNPYFMTYPPPVFPLVIAE